MSSASPWIVSATCALSMPKASRAAAPSRSIRCRSSTGANAANNRNGTSASAAGQANTVERHQHRRRHDDRNDRRADSVGIKIFDRFHVLRRQRDQIAGAAAQQIAGRQRIELAEQRDAHVGEQMISHGVRLPGLGPVQDTGKRRDQRKPDQKIAIGPPGLQRSDDERADDGDADIGGDAAVPETMTSEPPPPRRNEAQAARAWCGPNPCARRAGSNRRRFRPAPPAPRPQSPRHARRPAAKTATSCRRAPRPARPSVADRRRQAASSRDACRFRRRGRDRAPGCGRRR